MCQEFFHEDVEHLEEEFDRLEEMVREQEGLIEDVAGTLLNYGQAHERVSTLQERIEEQLERLRSATQHIANEPEESRASLYIISTFNVLEQEVDTTLQVVQSKEEELGPPDRPGVQNQPGVVQRFTSWIKNTLKPALKGIAQKIWQLLSNLLTPKEWKIHGDVGSPFLGLASAGIEITFGP